jgi:hypothetical protein
MAITTLKTVRLKSAGFVDLFTESEEQWQAMAKRAKEYASEFIVPSKLHQDDVTPFLVLRLELDTKVRNLVERKKLAQNRITWFGEYIVDEVWDKI